MQTFLRNVFSLRYMLTHTLALTHTAPLAHYLNVRGCRFFPFTHARTDIIYVFFMLACMHAPPNGHNAIGFTYKY